MRCSVEDFLVDYAHDIDDGDLKQWPDYFTEDGIYWLPMDDDALATFKACTGRTVAPTVPVSEAWLVVGRRGGKSFALALVAVWLAAFKDWRPYLAPGERATIMIIATITDIIIMAKRGMAITTPIRMPTILMARQV